MVIRVKINQFWISPVPNGDGTWKRLQYQVFEKQWKKYIDKKKKISKNLCINESKIHIYKYLERKKKEKKNSVASYGYKHVSLYCFRFVNFRSCILDDFWKGFIFFGHPRPLIHPSSLFFSFSLILSLSLSGLLPFDDDKNCEAWLNG